MHAKEVCQELWPRLNRAERGGGVAPNDNGHQWPLTLISNQEGGIKEGKRTGLKRGSEGRLHYGLIGGCLKAGTRLTRGKDRWPLRGGGRAAAGG
jgi:hypothetical protein